MSGDGWAPERSVAFQSEEVGESGGVVWWRGEDDGRLHGAAGKRGEVGDRHCHGGLLFAAMVLGFIKQPVRPTQRDVNV
ncbi:hypothetical protein QQP08_025405 [Theobroma cacao]|nr:hypothetical protein QQP08_025405 [Theobroma cacao]